MRKGEKSILIICAIVVAGMTGWNSYKQRELTTNDKSIPFYSTASAELNQTGGELVRKYQCRSCHSLWSLRDMLQAVPAPALDGIGSWRDQEWIYAYLSTENPQLVLPSRLKKEYQMPSYATMPDRDRRILAEYLSSLKVEEWYLGEARQAECRKLTGGDCR